MNALFVPRFVLFHRKAGRTGMIFVAWYGLICVEALEVRIQKVYTIA